MKTLWRHEEANAWNSTFNFSAPPAILSSLLTIASSEYTLWFIFIWAKNGNRKTITKNKHNKIVTFLLLLKICLCVGYAITLFDMMTFAQTLACEGFFIRLSCLSYCMFYSLGLTIGVQRTYLKHVRFKSKGKHFILNCTLWFNPAPVRAFINVYSLFKARSLPFPLFSLHIKQIHRKKKQTKKKTKNKQLN